MSLPTIAGDERRYMEEIAAAGNIRVGWSRGRGCRDIAHALAGDGAFHVEGDLLASVIAQRADAMVMKRLTRFDAVPTIVPHGVDLERIDGVWAAVGGGPHSPLAVSVANALGTRLGIPVEAVAVAGPTEDRSEAAAHVAELASAHRAVEPHVIEGSSVTALTDALGESTLLVVGAPGGSWFQRQIHGPGHRLTVRAPAGALVVRSAPRRCFQSASRRPGAVVGVHTPVTEVLRIATVPVVAVADEGVLVGLFRCRAADGDAGTAEVGEHMEPAVAVQADEAVAASSELADFFEGGPVPVVDGAGQLLGFVDASESG